METEKIKAEEVEQIEWKEDYEHLLNLNENLNLILSNLIKDLSKDKQKEILNVVYDITKNTIEIGSLEKFMDN